MNMPTIELFLVALLGAALQELAHWYSLRGRLQDDKYQKLIGSKGYWVTTILMVAAGSAGTVAWFHDSVPTPAVREYLLMGAAFPVLFKKAVQALVTNSGGDALGEEAAGARDEKLLNEYFS